jgi:hypothetical protein
MLEHPTRREAIAGGLGAALLGPRALGQDEAGPWKLPAGDDPAAMAVAEHRFWSEILRDHADFFLMLLPGEALAPRREEARAFRQIFDSHLRRAGDGIRREELAGVNRETIDDVKRFIEWKMHLRSLQAAGRIRSLVWPSFFQAAANEADHWRRRLERLSKGEPSLVRRETLELWLGDAHEHLAMIAHLLDPAETRLVHEATEASKAFARLKATPDLPPGDAERAAQERHLLEARTRKAVVDAQVHSIIHPLMADHMVREGLRFIEELKKLG